MNILFLHGLDSKPYQDRIDLLSKYGTVEMPFIDYRTETDVFGRISKIVESFNPDIIIGHSMGGILSYYLSVKYNKTNLMFMPAFFSSNAHFMNVPKDVINLQANNKKLAVIGTHDTAVDNKNTKKVLPANVIHEEPIGHQLSPMILDKYFKKIMGLTEMITTINEFKNKLNEDLMMGLDKIGHIAKEVTIELDLKHTQHSLGRQGRGSDYITNEDIKNAVGTATEQMVDLIIANKLNVGDSVLITRKEDRLNIVGALSLKKGTDIINFTVITCMRVEKFLNKNNTLQIFI